MTNPLHAPAGAPPGPARLESIGVQALSLLRVDARGASAREDTVAIEEPLELQLSFERRGARVIKSVAVTMRTPGHDRELAAGFLLTEGILDRADAIAGWEEPGPGPGRPAHGNVLRVVLQDGVEVDLRTLERHFYTTSSCGVCGKTSLEALRVTGRIRLEPEKPLLPAELIGPLPERLRAQQAIFARTGGLHGAGLFDAAGHLLAVREDVGRHNAVDKLIGSQFLAGRTPLAGQVLLVSGRASFELMQKAVMAGIPVLAAVGAPSSLAVDLAREFGATLLGFVGPERFNVYAGAQRIQTISRAPG